jgi:HKD family nuclease
VIVHQPHDKQLGIQLIEAIESNRYSQLTIMVAYAKLSGVYRISPYIDKFRKNGGEVRFIIGIDQHNTTFDALLQLSKLSDKLFVFHSEGIAQTFHIKCYWLKGENESWYAIGSNNLTAGGLFSNYDSV